ncbi:hypothetical protein [Parvularcula oceani]|uniref:hypothetical protein n=1 Tax=Parvularcula oceani TaxID=1247963 RepID=UPI0004E2060D|nr:hypothetical protein [Parvularcula oceani]
MSATALRPLTLPPAQRWIGVLALCAGALLAAWLTPLDAAGRLLASRAAQSAAVAPGAEATLLLAGRLSAASGLPAGSALLIASWSALPLLALSIWRLGREAPVRAAAGMLFLVCNPLVLWACAAGYGYAALGFTLMWSAVLTLREREVHIGVPRAGAGLALAAACTPGFQGFALPLFAVLFLAIPRSVPGRHMPSVYLVAFLPVCAWALTLAYAGWVTGAAGAGPLPGLSMEDDPVPAAFCIGLLLAIACAPGLVRYGVRRPARIAALLACALAATSSDVPVSLALLCAACAQGVILMRFGTMFGAVAGQLGALASVILLAPH